MKTVEQSFTAYLGRQPSDKERAAAAWANTPEGEIALGLAKAGSLRELASCSGKILVRKGTAAL